MEVIILIPTAFFVILLAIGIGLLGLGMQAVMWLAAHILIISIVFWVIVFLLALLLLMGTGKCLLGISYICPFIPFYMGAVALLFQWVAFLENGGLGGLIYFVLYVVAIPIGLAIHFIPSVLIVALSTYVGKEDKATITILNLAFAAIYGFVMYSNGGALIT